MAVDTRDKRSSSIGIDKPFLRLFQNPTGTIAQDGRQSTGLKYSGILASNPSGASAVYFVFWDSF